MNSRIIGTGSYLPDQIIQNEDLVRDGLDTTDDWIVSHTGIESRRIVAPDQATSDLAVHAARRALEKAGIAAEQLGYIVCATSTPDQKLPATANLIQHQLGSSCGAVDLNAGCSGFVHALVVGVAMQQQLGGAPVLVVGADAYSRILNWKDRTTAVFFGDGAGALVLGVSGDAPCLLAVKMGSDGSGAPCITTVAGGSRRPTTQEDLLSGADRLTMNGRAVWEFAMRTVPGAIREVVHAAGLSLKDVDLIIPHQANEKMLTAIAEELGVPQATFFCSVREQANTAAASVGIALDQALSSGRLAPGQIAVLVGFGAGLSWAAACVRI